MSQSALRMKEAKAPATGYLPRLNRLSLSSAWIAPLNRGSLNSAHIHGTRVPVEEPSTASEADMRWAWELLYIFRKFSQRESCLSQRHEIVLAHTLEDEKYRRCVTGIGDQMIGLVG